MLRLEQTPYHAVGPAARFQWIQWILIQRAIGSNSDSVQPYEYRMMMMMMMMKVCYICNTYNEDGKWRKIQKRSDSENTTIRTLQM
jgi:hypothetical protein